MEGTSFLVPAHWELSDSHLADGFGSPSHCRPPTGSRPPIHKPSRLVCRAGRRYRDRLRGPISPGFPPLLLPACFVYSTPSRTNRVDVLRGAACPEIAHHITGQVLAASLLGASLVVSCIRFSASVPDSSWKPSSTSVGTMPPLSCVSPILQPFGSASRDRAGRGRCRGPHSSLRPP